MTFENTYETLPVLLTGAASILTLTDTPINNGIINFDFRVIFRQPGNTRPPTTRLQTEFKLQARMNRVDLKLKEMLQSISQYLIPDSHGFLPQVIISAECQEERAVWESKVIFCECDPSDIPALSSIGRWWTIRPQKVRTFTHGEEELATFIPQTDTEEILNIRVLSKVYFRFQTPHEVLLETFEFVPLSSGRILTIDCSYDTIQALVSDLAFDDAIVAYDIYIEGHEQYAQRFIVRTNSMVKEFRFRNSLGTYDYIYAVGSQSQELETDVSTFINSGHEAELSNTSKMYFKSDSGYLDTAGQIRHWNNFLESHERYVLIKDGETATGDDSWRKIVVDEAESKTKGHELNNITFKWHYAENLNVRIADRELMPPYTLNRIHDDAPKF